MIYADAAASALKPMAVIDAQTDFLNNHYANSGRGVCARATWTDDMVAKTRKIVADLIGATDAEQIVFTSGATDGLNRIARIFAGKTVMVSNIDHHSARLPFEKHCNIILAPMDDKLNYDWNAICRMKADAIVITAMSNVLGVAQAIPADLAMKTIVDASQFIIHRKIDVELLNIDYLVFSGHKIGADTGIGVMYQKNESEPINWGGGMYQATGAARFEAGTLPLTQIAGLAAAIKELNFPNRYTEKLTDDLREMLAQNSRIRFISQKYASLITFTVDGMHHLDFGALMGANDICLRVGHMCTTWLHELLGIPGSIRLSLGPWNTAQEIEEIAKIANKIAK